MYSFSAFRKSIACLGDRLVTFELVQICDACYQI